MKHFIVSLIVTFGMMFASATGAGACSVQRHDAKVLADGTVRLNGSYSATVAALDALPRPISQSYRGPRVAAERVDYRVRGELLGFRLEPDGDIHAIIADVGRRAVTLVAEIPDPKCMTGAPGTYIRDVTQARVAFVRAYGIPPVTHFALAYKRIDVTGAAFFDFEHRQNGGAPNGFELHPVLIVNGSSSIAGSVKRAHWFTASNGKANVWKCPSAHHRR